MTTAVAPTPVPAPAPALPFIHPTIGRRCWYWPTVTDLEAMSKMDASQPFDAGVVYVWTDRMVNLDVCDHVGHHHARTSVQLVQPGDSAPESGGWCCWMPYQVGQAGRT